MGLDFLDGLLEKATYGALSYMLRFPLGTGQYRYTIITALL